MAKDVMIKVEHVAKIFKLPHEKHSSIKSTLISKFRKGNNSYERQIVLNDVSFEIKRGEFFGIVGRNGSGKSTLLKMLAGIYTPSEGSIQVNGKLTPFIELGVGFNPELTGRENVYLNGALLGFNRREMDEMYQDIVDFSEIEKFMDQKLKNYSSGMQVRLAFSIAIRAKSDILLLDEVLAVGDAAFQRKCFDYFMDLKKNKQTVILVTHDMSAVRQYCDRAVMIEKGKVVHSGEPDVVAQKYQRMFSDELDKSSETPKSNQNKTELNRWGEGGLITDKASVSVSDEEVTISTIYKANTSLKAPIYGFTVHGPGGTNVLEANTQRQRVKTTAVTNGDVITLTWRIPNIFASGTYNISTACCDQSATRFYDWLNEAATFKIVKDTTTAGVVDPNIELLTYENTGGEK